MGFAVRVYEAFKEDEVKAKVLAEFIEKVEEAISSNQVATRQDLNVQELKLTKEMKEIELRLTKEIEQLRGEVKRDIEHIRVEIQQSKVSILKWLIGLLITQTIAIIGVMAGFFQVLK